MKIRKESLIHLLFPRRCPLCDDILFQSVFTPEEYICGKCQGKPEYVKEPLCKKCGKPLDDERQEFCYDCGRKKSHYVQGKALWIYKGEVKDSLYRFKYHNRREYAAYYGEELVRVYGEWIEKCGIEAMIPIPLSRQRKRQRGFNQAELIAKEISRRTGIPVYSDLLLRIRNTEAQKILNDTERKNNLKNAFKTKENKVQLHHILLVDDIYTTGSTMNEAAKMLKQAGAEQIYCLSVSIGRGH